MDLLQTVRKEGSRGGRDEFKWSDVQNSNHRENYLGHSVMAPVGRWQKGRDLNWYSKSDSTEKDETGRTPAEIERDARKEEIRKIKEAEEDARCRALGLPVPDRNNPNLHALPEGAEKRRIGPSAAPEEPERKEKRRHRSRSRDRIHHRKHRDRSRDGRSDDRHRRSHRRRSHSPRSRSRSRDRRRDDDRRRDRSRSRDRAEDRDRRPGRERSRSRNRRDDKRPRNRSPYERRDRRSRSKDRG